MSKAKPAKTHPWKQWRPGYLSTGPLQRPLSSQPYPKGKIRRGANG